MVYGRYLFLAGLTVMVTALAIGCEGMNTRPGEVIIQREVDLDNKTVAVIPFREYDGKYFESELGTLMTEKIRNQMRANMPKTRFASALPVRQKMEESTEEMTLSQMGEAANADVVIVGRIKEFRTKDPGAIGYFRGTCELELTVYNVAGNVPIKKWTPTVYYPERGAGVSMTDLTEQQVHDNMVKYTADFIAKKFYTYKRSSLADPMDW